MLYSSELIGSASKAVASCCCTQTLDGLEEEDEEAEWEGWIRMSSRRYYYSCAFLNNLPTSTPRCAIIHPRIKTARYGWCSHLALETVPLLSRPRHLSLVYTHRACIAWPWPCLVRKTVPYKSSNRFNVGWQGRARSWAWQKIFLGKYRF